MATTVLQTVQSDREAARRDLSQVAARPRTECGSREPRGDRRSTGAARCRASSELGTAFSRDRGHTCSSGDHYRGAPRVE